MPRNRGKNTTLLASMGAEGMGPCLAVVGGTTGAVFEAYVEQVLARAVLAARAGRGGGQPRGAQGGSGARARRGAGVRAAVPAALLAGLLAHRGGLLEAQGAALRKAAARTREALVEAMGRALDAVTARDVRGWFAHCGYPLGAQPS